MDLLDCDEDRIYRGRIVSNPHILVGKPTVKGTRISVQTVLENLSSGYDLERLLDGFPSLTAEDVRACLDYAAAVVAGEKVDPLPGSLLRRGESVPPLK